MTEKSSEESKPPVDKSRRKALKVLGAGVALAAIAGIGGYAWQSTQKPPPMTSETSSPSETSSASAEGQTLKVLEWSGYEVEDLWRPFKEKHPDVRVEFSFAVDDAEMLTKLRAGFEADVVHPCSYMIRRFLDADLIEPIDTSLTTNWSNIYPEFQNHPDVQQGGDIYMMPLDWGYVSVTYRSDLVKEQTDSWELLWDERYKGSLAMWDSALDSVPLAGQLTGAKNMWDMTDEELEAAKKKLLAQKPLLRTYWTSETDIVSLMASGDVVAAQTWQSAALRVNTAGKPVVYMRPKEGRWGWLCGLCIVKGTKNKELAHEYVDAWADPRSGSWLINNYSYGHSNMNSAKMADPSIVQRLEVNDPEILKKTYFIQNMPRLEKYQEIWMEVKSG